MNFNPELNFSSVMGALQPSFLLFLSEPRTPGSPADGHRLAGLSHRGGGTATVAARLAATVADCQLQCHYWQCH